MDLVWSLTGSTVVHVELMHGTTYCGVSSADMDGREPLVGPLPSNLCGRCRKSWDRGSSGPINGPRWD